MPKILRSDKYVFIALFTLFMVYGYVSDDDYHKMFDKPELDVYTCRKILQYGTSGWHPDIPRRDINECIKIMKEENAKTT